MTDESKLPWVWWSPDEPEKGLLGFHTKEDRDRFSEDLKSGCSPDRPYRRRIADDGRTISQLEDWHAMVKRITKQAGIE